MSKDIKLKENRKTVVIALTTNKIVVSSTLKSLCDNLPQDFNYHYLKAKKMPFEYKNWYIKKLKHDDIASTSGEVAVGNTMIYFFSVVNVISEGQIKSVLKIIFAGSTSPSEDVILKEAQERFYSQNEFSSSYNFELVGLSAFDSYDSIKNLKMDVHLLEEGNDSIIIG